MKKFIASCFLAFFLLLSTYAAKMTIEQSESMDLVNVTVTLQDADFCAIQTIIKYDTAVLQPIGQNDASANNFDDFAVKSDSLEQLTSIGEFLDDENGLFGFAGYIMPGISGEGLNESGEYITSTPLKIYTFAFKRLKEGESGLSLAFEKNDEPFFAAVPYGCIIMNRLGEFDIEVSVKIPEKETPTTYFIFKSVNLTKENRLKSTVYLQDSNYAAAKNGELYHIDRSDKTVVPFIENGVFYIPVRFVCESLGAQVAWHVGDDSCTIKLAGKTAKIFFNSTEYYINEEKFSFTSPSKLMYGGRTMVPSDFMKNFGFDIYSFSDYAIVFPKSLPWSSQRTAEKQALSDMQLITSALIRDFV